MRAAVISRSFALLFIFLATACIPALPPGVNFSPQSLPLAQRVAGAVEGEAAKSNFEILYPELSAVAAPTWVRPGMRVTYRAGYATLTRPNYPRTEDDPPPPMPAGGGLIQYDLVAQDRRDVVLSTTFFNTDLAGQPPSPLGYVVAQPGLSDIWFSPQVLEKVVTVPEANLTAARLPMEVEGVTYNVVRMHFQSLGDAGEVIGEEIWAFEAETGLLVFYRQQLFNPDGSSRSGTVYSLVNRRYLQLPWIGGSAPDWVRPGAEIRLSGAQYLDAGLPTPATLSMEIHTRIRRVGRLWSENVHTVRVQGQLPTESAGATGVAQLFFGYWLSSAAIESLTVNTVLDRDPQTGIEIHVTYADSQYIVLAAVGAGHSTSMVYDARTGKLIGIYQQRGTVAGLLRIELQAQP